MYASLCVDLISGYIASSTGGPIIHKPLSTSAMADESSRTKGRSKQQHDSDLRQSHRFKLVMSKDLVLYNKTNNFANVD